MRLIKCQCLGKNRLSPSHLCSTFLVTQKMSLTDLSLCNPVMSASVRQCGLVTWVWTVPLGEWVWNTPPLSEPARNRLLCPWLCHRACAGRCVHHLAPDSRWGIIPVHPWMVQGFSSATTWRLSESIPGNQKGWASLWNFKGNSLVGLLTLSCHVIFFQLYATLWHAHVPLNPTNFKVYLS